VAERPEPGAFAAPDEHHVPVGASTLASSAERFPALSKTFRSASRAGEVLAGVSKPVGAQLRAWSSCRCFCNGVHRRPSALADLHGPVPTNAAGSNR